jgi:uracil-DNA glycosylase
LEALRPRLVVALGATAAKALLRQRFRITHSRGEEEHAQFVADLRIAARYLQDKSDR